MKKIELPQDESFEIIIGIHSIAHALLNSDRLNLHLFGEKIALDLLRKNHSVDLNKIPNLNVHQFSPHRVQDQAKYFFNLFDYKYNRVVSNIFLISKAKPISPLKKMYDEIKVSKGKKIICLDQVTDIHNAASITRTAAFYNVDYMILPSKGSFGLSPSFYRLSSGGLEYIDFLQTVNLSKVIKNLNEIGVETIGFEEKAETQLNFDNHSEKNICLVMGAEDKGLSHAVKRNLKNKISLNALGKIETLNVSVASALAMEKFFSIK